MDPNADMTQSKVFFDPLLGGVLEEEILLRPEVFWATPRNMFWGGNFRGAVGDGLKTAFLNGELEEKMYMTRPDVFVVKGQEDKVCKLQKALYGLKQAPKQWHEKFDVILISVEFSVNEVDRCVYYQHGGG
jgi:hypothetical protein